ncbi:MAG: manganese efflux pump MntP family protein [Dehalococcoidia bacterium]|nr:manganese efflux pump MntP family protein [Dehalococcoidia bacterium]
MSVIELLLISVGLSMDAFAAAICIGLAAGKKRVSKALMVGLYFGVFQTVMPLIGYFMASLFAEKITAFDHWVAFVLLGFLGGKMILMSLKRDGEPVIQRAGERDDTMRPAQMLPLAIATSIDALAVGVSFAFLQVSILSAVVLIGCITFAFSAFGVMVGNMFGVRFKPKAELVGGIILVLLGIKILLEHMNVISF